VYESQRRSPGKKAPVSGYTYKVIAALTLAAGAAAGYLALEPRNLPHPALPGPVAASGCDPASATGDCDPVPALASLPARPADASIPTVPAPQPPATAPGAAAAVTTAPQPRELRPGYTLAELCAAGLDDAGFRCQTGHYDGGFSTEKPGWFDGRPDGHTLSGRVLDNAGTGLAGITLIATPERLAGQRNADDTKLRFWTVTDSLGRYLLEGLPDGEYSIRSRAEGAYPSVRISARAGVDYADLVLQPKLALVAEGRVTGADGEPLGGVTVLPLLPGQPSVLTGDDGRFSLPLRLQPTAGAYTLRFQLPGFHEQTSRFALGQDDDLRVVLQPVQAWTSVKGRLRSDSGEALAGRTLQLRPPSAQRSYTAVTDDEGRYEFPVVESPADYRLSVSGGAGHKDLQQAVRVTARMGDLDLVAESYDYGTVSGQLVNLDGEPVPGFELVLRNSASRQPNALVSTNEDGNFEVAAAPAGQLVVASQSTPAILVEGLALRPGDRLHLPLVLDWGQHELRGRVVDERGNPVPASRILLQWSHQADGLTTRTTRRTAADTQGEFAFSQLGPGPHALQIDAAGHPTVVVNHDVSRQGYDLTVRLN